MQRDLTLGWTLGLALSCVGFACGDDGGNADGAGDTASASETGADAGTTAGTGSDTGSVDSTGGEPEVCHGIGGEAANGDACTANSDCMSGVCTLFTDVPKNDDAVCAETPADCSTRITATVFDFALREPVANVDVKVAKALDAILVGPTADAVIETQTNADGRIDVTSDGPIEAPIAILALAGGDETYHMTATGLAGVVEGTSAYNVANAIHDLWVVPNAAVEGWNAGLAEDAALAEYLPIGEKAAVVGLVRDAETGAAVSGAVIDPAGDETLIRYLDADGGFTGTATGDTGIFIAVGVAQTGEDFVATVGGESVATGRAGARDGILFTLILNADVP